MIRPGMGTLFVFLSGLLALATSAATGQICASPCQWVLWRHSENRSVVVGVYRSVQECQLAKTQTAAPDQQAVPDADSSGPIQYKCLADTEAPPGPRWYRR